MTSDSFDAEDQAGAAKAAEKAPAKTRAARCARAHADLEADVLEFRVLLEGALRAAAKVEPGQCDPDAAAACQQLCAAFLELRDAASGAEERERDIADADALWEDLEGAPAEAAEVEAAASMAGQASGPRQRGAESDESRTLGAGAPRRDPGRGARAEEMHPKRPDGSRTSSSTTTRAQKAAPRLRVPERLAQRRRRADAAAVGRRRVSRPRTRPALEAHEGREGRPCRAPPPVDVDMWPESG